MGFVKRTSKREYDPDRLLEVAPGKVLDYIGGEVGNRFETRGQVEGGDWDLAAKPFQKWDVFRAIQSHFRSQTPWDETDYFKRSQQEVQNGNHSRGARNEGDFKQILENLDLLYADIRDHGFQTQAELDQRNEKTPGWEPANPFTKHDDVTVAINRKGQFMLQDGKHRLSIATVLDMDSIPVAIGRRHEKWEAFKEELEDYTAGRDGFSYQPFTHPDLQSIKVQHDSSREKLILNHMPPTAKTILDIGAYIGYFDLYFGNRGYDCTAVEHHPRHAYFMKKLREAEHLDFEIVQSSFLEWKCSRHFDVILALNIFHHFIQSEALMARLEEQLSAISTSCIFLETHLPEDAIMKESYRNFEPEEFAEYVRKKANLSKFEMIGHTSRGRSLFKIYNGE